MCIYHNFGINYFWIVFPDLHPSVDKYKLNKLIPWKFVWSLLNTAQYTVGK